MSGAMSRVFWRLGRLEVLWVLLAPRPWRKTRVGAVSGPRVSYERSILGMNDAID